MQKLDDKFTKEVSLSIGIAPAYIEKDYYIVELLKIIASFQNDSFSVTFSGGTSLSKGFGIINRFSEDIDFMVLSNDENSRSVYRTFRKSLFEKIDATGILKVSEDEKIMIKTEESKNQFLDRRIPWQRQRTKNKLPFSIGNRREQIQRFLMARGLQRQNVKRKEA